MSYLTVIVARMGSSRLPGKGLMEVAGRSMLGLLVDRVRKSRYVEDILLLTTTLEEDDRLVEFADNEGLLYFRGSPDDVLGRIDAGISSVEKTYQQVIEILGDNPLTDPELVDDVVEFHLAGGFDYSANLTREYASAPAELPRFPVGVRVQVSPPETFRRCARETADPVHREHATSYIAENPDLFRIGYFPASGKWAEAANEDGFYAVNTREQLEEIRDIVNFRGADVGLREVVSGR